MSNKQNPCTNYPDFMGFQNRNSFILWAEFNLLFLVQCLRGGIDLSALFSIVTITSLVLVKGRQFVDHSSVETDSEPQQYLNLQAFEKFTDCLVNSVNKGIHCLVSMKSLECYLKFIGAVVVGSFLLNMFSTCSLLFLSGNGLFLMAFLKNFLKVDVCQVSDMYMKKLNDATKSIQIPKYKESKKNI